MKYPVNLTCLGLMLGACTSAHVADEDARVSEFDAGRPMVDAGSDAGPSDATLPVEPDGGPPDGGPLDTDGDGVPDVEDCAVDDDTMGREASRACSNPCGDGLEECEAGVWGACDAATDCLCDAEGEARVVACGNCGDQAESCTGGVWAATSACLDQGECAIGVVERRDRTYCRVEERLCRSDCTWSGYTTVVPAGECAGVGLFHCDVASVPPDAMCNAACMWVDNPGCPINP